jgi:hypothetical protein
MKQVLSLKQIKAVLTDSDRELAKDDYKNKFSKFSNNNNRSPNSRTSTYSPAIRFQSSSFTG